MSTIPLFLVLVLSTIVHSSLVVEVQTNSTVLVNAKVVRLPLFGNVTSYMQNFTLYKAPEAFEGVDNFATVNDEIQVLVYKPCSVTHKYATSWNTFGDIQEPTVFIQDSSFNILVPYLRENFTYVVDMCDLQATSSCASKRASQFYSAPTALFPSANTFPAYDISNSIWNVTTNNCSSTNVQSNFTFGSLLQCKDIQSGKFCANVSSIAGTPFIDYRGSLKIAAFQNQVMIRKWEFPYSYKFNSVTDVVSGQSFVNGVSFSVSSFMNQDGLLVILVKTTTRDAGKYLSSANFENTLDLAQTPANAQAQVWEFISKTASIKYSAEYKFTWTLLPDAHQVSVTVAVSLTKQPTVSQQYTLNTKLEVYRDNFTTASSGPFSSSSNIYVASVFQGEPIYELQIVNAWVCFPKFSQLPPEYDPARNLFGCKVPSPNVPAENIFQIVKDENSTNSKFQLQIFKGMSLQGKSAAGFGFSSNLDERVYYIHVETKMVSKRRSFHASEYVAIDVNTFFVFHQDKLVDLNRQIATMYAMYGLLGFLVVGLLGVIIGYCIVRKKLKTLRKRKELNRLIKCRSVFLNQNLAKNISFRVNSAQISTIDTILEDEALIEVYKLFCIKENREEALMFYLAVKEYEAIPASTERNTKFAAIVNQYIKKGSTFELNMPDEMREKTANTNDFDTVMQFVKLEMQMDSMKRFVGSLRDNKWVTQFDPKQISDLAERVV